MKLENFDTDRGDGNRQELAEKETCVRRRNSIRETRGHPYQEASLSWCMSKGRVMVVESLVPMRDKNSFLDD